MGYHLSRFCIVFLVVLKPYRLYNDQKERLMMKILVTGLSGFVGTHLAKLLLEQGHEVVGLSRDPKRAADNHDSRIKWFRWNPEQELPSQESLAGVDSVINLVGENIAAKRWSEEQKKKILDSRIKSTKNLIEAINQFRPELKSLVNGSAVGIYQKNLNETIDEDSSIDNDFLADVCQQWENATTGISSSIRKVIIRIGVVMGTDGGALARLLPIFKLGGGGPIGSGKAYMPWIHVEDLARLLAEAAVGDKFEGVYNGVSPQAATNLEFTKALANSINRPAFLPVPPVMLKLIFGEMSSVILDGQKVKPQRAIDAGFKFKFSDINEAMNNLNGN